MVEARTLGDLMCENIEGVNEVFEHLNNYIILYNRRTHAQIMNFSTTTYFYFRFDQMHLIINPKRYPV